MHSTDYRKREAAASAANFSLAISLMLIAFGAVLKISGIVFCVVDELARG